MKIEDSLEVSGGCWTNQAGLGRGSDKRDETQGVRRPPLTPHQTPPDAQTVWPLLTGESTTGTQTFFQEIFLIHWQL